MRRSHLVSVLPILTVLVSSVGAFAQDMAEERKDDLMRQLAICESGGYGDSERPIYGGGGSYVGRFQFTVRAVISYVREMDGRVLASGDALLLAQDYRQAAALAKYVIFVRGDLWNWPACGHKLRLADHVTRLKAM